MHVDCPLILLPQLLLLLLLLQLHFRLPLLLLFFLFLLLLPSALVPKEVKSAEQLVRPSYAQDAKLEDGHVVGHVHVQCHQLLCGQRMPGPKGAGRVHLWSMRRD